MQVKDFVRPPFANYDIVVYFGCGLFSLPLLFRYLINPLGLVFPSTDIPLDVEFARTTITTLVALFSVYILGHIIAFLSSHCVEKSVDLFFGKISTAVILSNIVPKERFGLTVQKWIFRRVCTAFKRPHSITTGLRLLSLAPVMPTIVFLVIFRQIEYFRSRISRSVYRQIYKDFRNKGYGVVSLKNKWYKTIEHDIINNFPTTTARMYNYLIISGIFRSLAFIFLGAAWFELVYWVYYPFEDASQFKSIWTTSDGSSPFWSLAALNVVFGFCLSAYLKFARRYVEEALFGFVLCERD